MIAKKGCMLPADFRSARKRPSGTENNGIHGGLYEKGLS